MDYFKWCLSAQRRGNIMSYYHIPNLYQDQSILLFKECYALEKIHGTSAHILYKDDDIVFFSGGVKYEEFVKLFSYENLLSIFREHFTPEQKVCVYGEAYGGKCQGMSTTYGPNLKFVAFEVLVDGIWLKVPDAETVVKFLGLEFVFYRKIPTDIESINRERDAPSIQAVRNGIPDYQPMFREGIVLRPLEEMIKNNGGRVIAKHKRDEFRETKTPRNVIDKSEKREKLIEVNKIIDEWLTERRLDHVLDNANLELKVENIGKIIPLMMEDIYREGKGEIEESQELKKAIGRETALMFKRRLNVIK
jgi:hypothetical protein